MIQKDTKECHSNIVVLACLSNFAAPERQKKFFKEILGLLLSFPLSEVVLMRIINSSLAAFYQYYRMKSHYS